MKKLMGTLSDSYILVMLVLSLIVLTARELMTMVSELSVSKEYTLRSRMKDSGIGDDEMRQVLGEIKRERRLFRRTRLIDDNIRRSQLTHTKT
jgi:hypothetical protein